MPRTARSPKRDSGPFLLPTFPIIGKISMMTEEAVKRKIRKALLLASDSRGDKATARAAASLAKRLLKANGWTEDDVRAEGAEMPGDHKARSILANSKRFQRYKTVSMMVLTQFKGLTIYCRAGKASPIVLVDFSGPAQVIEPAQKLWHALNRLVDGEWFSTERSQEVNRHLADFLGSDPGNVVTYEPSWLQGLEDGFLTQHHRYTEFKAIQKQQQEERECKQLPPAKLKRCRRWKKNPLALMVLPKPEPEKVLEAEIVEERSVFMRNGSSIVLPKEALETPEEDSRPNLTPQTKHSFRAGFRYGTQLFSRVEKLKI